MLFLFQGLLNGVTLYFTVRATNSQGGSATATCTLPTFDTTLPGGRVDIAFKSTSHPGILKASAVLHEDSEIMNSRLAIGFGVDINGDQIIPWQHLDSISKRQSEDASGINIITEINIFKLSVFYFLHLADVCYPIYLIVKSSDF